MTFESLGGYCKSPNLFIRNTSRPDPDGILSETIFGPIKSYRCSCGSLSSRALDGGKICPKCGVVCDNNNLRLSTFGKIKTVFPFIKPTKRVNLLKLIGKENKQLLDPLQADASAALSRYISIKIDESEFKIVNDISTITPGWIYIPFRITGIYSLYFVLKYLYSTIGIELFKPIFEENYFTTELSILPPEIRPIFKDPKKPNEVIRVEVNDYYISVLNLNKRNEIFSTSISTDEDSWIEIINYNLKNGLHNEEIVEAMSIEYDRLTALYQFYIDEIYKWAFSTLSGKRGLIRSSILSKTIEFSARTVVVVDPSLPPHEIKVSKKILYKLWMPYFLWWLCTVTKRMSYDDALYKIAAQEYYVNKDLFNEFCDWFCNTDEPINLYYETNQIGENI